MRGKLKFLRFVPSVRTVSIRNTVFCHNSALFGFQSELYNLWRLVNSRESHGISSFWKPVLVKNHAVGSPTKEFIAESLVQVYITVNNAVILFSTANACLFP